MGPNGSGKGDKCQRLANDYGYLHVGMSNLFRERNHLDPSFEELFVRLSEKGEMIPDVEWKLTLSHAIDMLPANQKIAYDGAVRNLHQAEKFYEAMHECGRMNFVVVELELDDSTAIQRCHERAQKSSVPRAEDMDEDIIIGRLVKYRDQHDPIKLYYKERGVKVIIVPTKGSIHEVTRDLYQKLQLI